jgi:hypothetical protein
MAASRWQDGHFGNHHCVYHGLVDSVCDMVVSPTALPACEMDRRSPPLSMEEGDRTNHWIIYKYLIVSNKLI